MKMKSALFIPLLILAVLVNTVPPTIAAAKLEAAECSAAAYPTDEDERQWIILVHDLEKQSEIFSKAKQTFRHESLIWPSDKDPLDIVLRRTSALLDNLKNLPGTPDLSDLEKSLKALKSESKDVDTQNTGQRRELFGNALGLRRKIAFSNPLLDFNELMFIKRHRSIFNHMCDQFYGIAARPGGGLYVLSEPFGSEPALRDVLADSVVSNGRLKGRKLDGGPNRNWTMKYDGLGKLTGEETEGGSFLSPELSFDGTTALFSYVECEGDRHHRTHTDPSRGHWAEGRSYHIFKVNMDGSDLVQLTDGTWNDFQPCWMPSGRIAYISERRGGYLRCGRVCPTYTVYDMAADGRDIRCLSFHETNEWTPSVTNDGMIMYTRWDYVDRHGVISHTPWTMTPDGRDPRAVQGNYAFRKERADMELNIRAIPGSHRFAATAAPHHGQAFGSLVIIDPRVPDDDRMAPVKRLTPDVDFPESQDGTETYGEAWPLSEDYYLCVYDPATEVPELGPKGHYGIYLVDSFGNKELVYRDPEIGSHNPIPVRPRTIPPVVLDQSVRVAAHQTAEAVVGVLNVYNSQVPWPKETKIKALRVFQIIPLSVASADVSHNTGLQIPQGSDSVNLARAVLGEVPVEEDGSAYFVVPARKELFFQALDDRGLAVTSMRSGTQFQPGEQATCQGCHEPRHDAPTRETSTRLAMLRPPSRLTPGPDGTNPFSYPRLVQPVLERHCVACHADEPDAPPLSAALAKHPGKGGMNVPTTYFTSYLSLAPEFGFYDYGGKDWDDPKWYRTTPGEFGARASRLYKLLQDGHYDVKLPAEDLRRITLWLDSCSVFYGVYEKDLGEAQLCGEIVRPTLE